jgi:Fe2+ or Zn2+ uptake regulation protein
MLIPLFFKTCFMYADNDETLITKLKEHHVHLTQNRVAVFKLLTESTTALSVSVITKQSPVHLDRISVYRTLLYFLRKGIVEIVPNNKGNAKYILASSNKATVKNRDSKCAFFICSSCQHTELILEPVNIKPASLTKHHVSKYSLILEGLCSNCKSMCMPLILLFGTA